MERLRRGATRHILRAMVRVGEADEPAAARAGGRAQQQAAAAGGRGAWPWAAESFPCVFCMESHEGHIHGRVNMTAPRMASRAD